MTGDSNEDHEFDFASFIQSPMAMLTGAMAAADTMRKTMGAMVESVQSLQKSAAALESILERVDNVVSQIEGPAKVLGPEMERLATRVATMSNLFDKTPVEKLPELFDTLTDQMNGVLVGMAEIPKRLGPLGDLLGGAATMFGMGRGSTPAAVATPALATTTAPKKAPAKPRSSTAGVKAVAKRPTRTTAQTNAKKAPAKRSGR